MVFSVIIALLVGVTTTMELPSVLFASRVENPTNTYIQELRVLACEDSEEGDGAWVQAAAEEPIARVYLIYLPGRPNHSGQMLFAKHVYIVDEGFDVCNVRGLQVDTDVEGLTRAAPIEIWFDRGAAESYLDEVNRALSQ